MAYVDEGVARRERPVAAGRRGQDLGARGRHDSGGGYGEAGRAGGGSQRDLVARMNEAQRAEEGPPAESPTTTNEASGASTSAATQNSSIS